MLPTYDWNLRKFRKLGSDFFSIGQVTGRLLKHQLVLASTDNGTGPIMTWSHGIVGLMRAVTDIDKTFGTFFFIFKSVRNLHALISSLLVKRKTFDERPCQYRRQNEND
ncbi:hypothetical protein GHT06_004490 [Daphnia sinensis]|uniref:Uncharacterized protein n=1 Tax=Daphnia sinensis TaxID=1820382 RepID=A0AAD5KFY5_9CRUS|nr:hypothetical protein GHT06_004490 [Daphnia sinensis]